MSIYSTVANLKDTHSVEGEEMFHQVFQKKKKAIHEKV